MVQELLSDLIPCPAAIIRLRQPLPWNLRYPDYMSTECTFIVLYIIFCAIDRFFAFFSHAWNQFHPAFFKKANIRAPGTQTFLSSIPIWFAKTALYADWEKTLLSVGIFLHPGYVRASHAIEQNLCIAYQTNNSTNKCCGRYYAKLIFLSGGCHSTRCVCFLFNYIPERKKENETDI